MTRSGEGLVYGLFASVLIWLTVAALVDLLVTVV